MHKIIVQTVVVIVVFIVTRQCGNNVRVEFG
jgi:hypothetical protein